MNLVATVTELSGRVLTSDEVFMLSKFQKKFDIEDDDPLVVVLALMAQSQIILSSAPDLLQQKVVDTIELHRNLLRDQAVIISKELIQVLAESNSKKTLDVSKVFNTSLFPFIGGILITFVVLALFKYNAILQVLFK